MNHTLVLIESDTVRGIGLRSDIGDGVTLRVFDWTFICLLHFGLEAKEKTSKSKARAKSLTKDPLTKER